MATLEKKKVNSNCNNRYKPLSKDVQVGAYRCNLTGAVSIIINNDPEDGEDEYKLTLSTEDVKSLAWIWKYTNK